MHAPWILLLMQWQQSLPALPGKWLLTHRRHAGAELQSGSMRVLSCVNPQS